MDFGLASSEAEQIAVNDVVEAVDPDAKQSQIARTMVQPLNAIKLLRAKLNFLIKVVEESPEVRQDHKFMRQLNQIVNQVPIATKADYDSQVLADYQETQLLSLMAQVTKSTGHINSLIETFDKYKRTIKGGVKDGGAGFMDDGMLNIMQRPRGF